ncbi:hypothetical protein BKA81DRAFT_10550 [Phyllosticta paracitricarpa]
MRQILTIPTVAAFASSTSTLNPSSLSIFQAECDDAKVYKCGGCRMTSARLETLQRHRRKMCPVNGYSSHRRISGGRASRTARVVSRRITITDK